MSDALTIRKCSEDDHKRILALFEEVFEERRTPEFWHWQFWDSEHGQSWIALAEAADALIGHHSLIRFHLNYLGREIVAGQEVDAMIREEFRGQQVYSRLSGFNEARMRQEGVQALFGFQSRNSSPGSYPLAMRYLGYSRVCNLRRYSLRVGARRLPILGHIYKLAQLIGVTARTALRRSALSGGIQVEVTDRVPDDLDVCLRQVRDYEVLAVWKDVPYLRWRYERHPNHRYLFHVLRVRGRAEGLAVSRVAGHTAAVCDLLHRTKNLPESAYLLSKVVAHYVTSRAEAIEFYGYDNGYFDAVFEMVGFKRFAFSHTIAVARSLGDLSLGQSIARSDNWTLAYGDTDSI